METNFYYGGSINADFAQFKEWEKQERKKQKNMTLAQRNKYRTELDSQLFERNLEKINKQKMKNEELVESRRKSIEDLNFFVQDHKGKNEKKKQLKEIYDYNADLVQQRKMQEKQKLMQLEKKVAGQIESVVGMTEKGISSGRVNTNLIKAQTEGRLGIKSSDLNAKKAGFLNISPKKIYDMGSENEKKEFFKSVTEHQLKMEKNYLNVVQAREAEKQKSLNKWIEKGIHEEVKRHDEKNQKLKNFQENLKTEIRSGLESQVKMRNQLKQVQQMEDRAFIKLRNSIIQKDIEKEVEKKEKIQYEKDKYKHDLKGQLKYTTKVDQYRQKLNEEGKYLENNTKDTKDFNKNSNRNLSQKSELQTGLSPREKYDSVIFKSPVEKFTGSLIMQTPHESKNKFDFSPTSPSVSRALGTRNLIRSRPFERILSQ